MPDAEGDRTRNRDLWTSVNESFTDEHAARAWAAEALTWGLFGVPERDLGVLGAVAGLDLTPAQLATAARCQERFGLAFPLVEATAEDVPFAAASFDLVVSEYGASVWCDPERWVAEAARLLRPGGRLVFLTNSVLASLCVPEAGLHPGAAPAAATDAAPARVAGRRDRVPS